MSDPFAGCLLGGAVGDALGAPFEGLWSWSIPPHDDLLAGYAEFEGYPPGQFTDDTQLGLALVESLVEEGELVLPDIIRRIAELWRTRRVIGPGGACTIAAENFLRRGRWEDCGAPPGQAGNGAAMRLAPLGLWFLSDPAGLPEAAAAVSRLTHQDPRGVAGGVAVAVAARDLAAGGELRTGRVAAAMEPFDAGFAAAVRALGPDTTDDAVAWAGQDRPEFDRPIITPFVVPTVLACFRSILRHPDSWSDAVAATIGLGGDVDTTGAIAGGLMGAKLGAGAIPPHLAAGVVDAERIRALARRLRSRV